MLDALGTLDLDSDAARRLALSPGKLSLDRVVARSAEHLLLEYQTETGGRVCGQGLANAKTFDRVARDSAVDAECPLVAVVRSKSTRVLLQSGGADRKLLGLKDLLAREGATLVSHRPERRAVVRIEDSAGVRFAKVVPIGKFDRLVSRHQAICSLPCFAFRTPAILSLDPKLGVIEFESLSGVGLSSLAKNDPRFAKAWRRTGRALRSLHRSTQCDLQVHDARAEVSLLRKRLHITQELARSVFERLSTHATGVMERLLEAPSPHRVIHRDFYDKQVVVSKDDRIGIIDLDTAAIGEPALDLANMLVHIELRVLQDELPERLGAKAARALLQGYDPDDDTTRRLQTYCDAARIRLACLYALRPRWSAIPEMIVERIGTTPFAAADSRNRPAKQPSPRPRVMASPFVCVVGCPRSGTTMLERMLDAHPLVAMAHETHWITKYNKRRYGLDKNGHATPELLDQLYADARFARMGVERGALDDLISVPTTYPTLVSQVFQHYRRGRGKPLAGDKSTGGYVRDIPALHANCPDTHIVHLIRDGRDVCLSMLNWAKADMAAGRNELWQDHPLATTALWWRWHVLRGGHGGAQIPPELYHELRYESIVADPQRQCAAFCETLGLPTSDAMAAFHVGRTHEQPDGSANRSWIPPTPGLRNWRTQMRDQDVELFEALAGDALNALGYERRFPKIAPAVANAASDFIAAWVAGGNELPDIETPPTTHARSAQEEDQPCN